ncbi:MAG: hypothetical protein LBJ00_02160 [Planctomycetaceae bacterium]|jgi:hypothetical protein|nr:hypothetical protein [Planctomycetaceae bacterium]
MKKSILIFVLISFIFLMQVSQFVSLSYCVEVTKPVQSKEGTNDSAVQSNAVPIIVREQQYELHPYSSQFAQDKLREYFDCEHNAPFYLYLSGVFNTPGQGIIKGWLVYRSKSQQLRADKINRWGILLQGKKEIHPLYSYMTTDVVVGDDEVEIERIAVVFGLLPSVPLKNVMAMDLGVRNRILRTQYGEYGIYSEGSHLAVPVDITATKNLIPFICKLDREIEFVIPNVSVLLESNFSDYDHRDEKNSLARSTKLLEVAVAVSEYISKPFPARERIEKIVNKHYFDRFEPSKKNLIVEEEIKLNISYTLETTAKPPEWIRLRATSGKFRREKNDVYYKATESGKQTIFLEAIAGTGANGSPIYEVSLAEQLQIEIDVTESTIVFPLVRSHRSWESLDGRYTIEAKLVSVTVGKDDKRYVTLERQDNGKKTTAPLDQLSKPDQEYIQLQIDKQENKK